MEVIGRRLSPLGKIDETDMRILAELVTDAYLSVPKLSKKIKVNSSVVYSRIKRLIKRGIIRRFTIDVNEELLGYNVTAIVGASSDAKIRELVLDEVLGINAVRDASEVTGRFDLVITVKAKSLDELHDIISERMGKINGILHTETFIEMKRKRKEPKYTIPE
jgi:Lrp/AsnC family transcriptional regulator for asnA, asnC and gidA